MKASAFLFLLFITSTQLLAQEHAQQAHHEGETEFKKNLISFAFGYAYIQEASHELNTSATKGIFVPSIGVDYFRRLSHQWEIGLMTDVELAEYLIVKEDLNREYATLIVAVAVFEPLKHLCLIAGGGIEFEHHEHIPVFRAGLEIPFHVSNKWIMAPSFIYDIKKGYNTISLSLAFERAF